MNESFKLNEYATRTTTKKRRWKFCIRANIRIHYLCFIIIFRGFKSNKKKKSKNKKSLFY